MPAVRQPRSAFIARSSTRRLTQEVPGSWGERQASFAMKTSLVIALTVAFVLAGGSALAVMNKACKSSHHPWCAPTRTHIKVGT
jgi:hypothetical protein